MVSNDSSHTITAIFVTPTSDPSWRLSWLDEPLLPGHEWSLHLPDDMYDVRIVDDRPPEGAYYDWFEIELRGGSQHDISWVDSGGQQPLYAIPDRFAPLDV